MKIWPYSPTSRLSVPGFLLLLAGAVILGVSVGALAYFISNFVYLVFVFPLAIGVLAMLGYQRLILFAKVTQPWILILTGVVIGILIAVSFYAVPYMVVRSNFVKEGVENYQVDSQFAQSAFDQILLEETGSPGFLGFMKIRAREGDTYTQYFVVNSIPVQAFNFTLQSAWAWIYWTIETLLFALPLAFIGYETAKRPFSQGTNDWYEQLPKQIGQAAIESKDQLEVLLHDGQAQRLADCLVDESEITHPMIEVYAHQTSHQGGDILLTLKETYRASPTQVKRKTLSQWEIAAGDYDGLFLTDRAVRPAGQ